MEYTGDRKNYNPPIRTSENDSLEIKLFCYEDGCNQYIKGVEGYNGGFTSEDGEFADLRNVCWCCSKHRKD
jgi:hypothetical protein